MILALASAMVLPARAEQEPAIESVFRSGIEIVRGRITQDGRGRTPKRLVKDDFEIKQNGVSSQLTSSKCS